jgi:hypothetical protein
MPAVYSAPAAAPCTNCGITTEAAPAGPAPSTYVPQQQELQPQAQPQPQQPQPQPQQPTLGPSDNPSPERTLLNKPTNGAEEPTPATESHEHKDESSANYLEAPQLFNPSDRTAQRSAAPVWNAVYHQEASADNQLQADAAGWTSASN